MTSPPDVRGRPTVSVVITTRGRPELARAVDGVLAQSHPALEIIVVDDRTPDTGTGPLAVDAQQVRMISTGGIGGNAARNRGIARCRGELIALLDDDDYWFPWKLAEQVAALPGNWRGRPVVISAQALVEHSGAVQPRFPYQGGSLAQWLFCTSWRTLRGDACLQTSGLLFVATLRESVGFDEELSSHQDWDWILRVARLPGAEIITVGRPLYLYSASASDRTSKRPDVATEQAWAHRTLDRGSPEFFGYFVITGFYRALQGRNWPMAWTALRTGVTGGRFHGPSFVTALLSTAGYLGRRLAAVRK